MANEEVINEQNNGNMDNTSHPNSEDNAASATPTPRADPDIPLDHLVLEVSQFAASLSLVDESHSLDTPKYVAVFLDKFESELQDYESFDPSSASKLSHPSSNDNPSFLDAVSALSSLVASVSKFKSTSNSASILLNLATSQLHRAMLVLEDELRALLNDKDPSHDTGPDQCLLSDRPRKSESNDAFPQYSPDDISAMSVLSQRMISAGYGVDCIKVFMLIRRGTFEDALASQGFEKVSIDDVQRMQWEALENEIANWIQILKHCISHLFPGELAFYTSVFSSTPSDFHPNHEIKILLFSNLAAPVIQHLINFANAVPLTKKSSEKLFKFLDMYESLRELRSWLDSSSLTDECRDELKLELAAAGACLGEASVSIFYELEMSIKSDIAKNPVPNGAVHPLTRYTMNYLKYTCEYKESLEELFLHHETASNGEVLEPSEPANSNGRPERRMTPFIGQLMRIMDLLDGNLEAKSKLYRDPSLRYIFLMNNGRYMLQKIKGSTETHEAMGDNWCRKRSSDLRNYHKYYQRESWGKVLQCLNPEGLTVNGKVQKLVLKERFKSFNQAFDELHRAQSMWVVSDEQMKSELKVSISAVMIPAYRAFLARFGGNMTPGRQYDKHVKYQPDDIESAVEELFEGSVASMAKRRT